MQQIFSSIETKRANDAVYEHIENMILSGQLKPGDRLPSERELMKLYKRSHPTIREAIRMLEASNYIRVIPGGYAEVSYADIEGIYDEVRELLLFKQVSFLDICRFIMSMEPQLVKKAVLKHTWEDISVLESALQEMADCSEDCISYSSKMFNFHLCLIQATHNPLSYVIWNSLREFWKEEHLLQCKSIIKTQDFEVMQKTHANILVYLREKNIEQLTKTVITCWETWWNGRQGGTEID